MLYFVDALLSFFLEDMPPQPRWKTPPETGDADDDDFDLETGATKRGRRPKQDDEDKGTAGHSAKCLVHVLNSMVDKPFVPDRSKSGPCTSTQGRKVKAQKQVPVETPSWEALSKMAGVRRRVQ